MAAPSWAPTPAQVGAIMPTRFGTAGITEFTSPTTEQVQAVIEDLVPGLLEEVGTLGDEQFDLARTTLKLGAAAYIENLLVPEQNDDLNAGNGEFYRRRYQEHVVLLRRAVRTARRVRTGHTLADPIAAVDVLPAEGFVP